MHIRPAVPADAAALAEIYTHHILHGTGTFEEEPVTAAEMAARLDKVVSRGWPWIVAERDGAVVGYAYAAQFRDRAAYRFAGEDSVYIREGERGGGIGTALLEALLVASRAAGFRYLFAVIGDSANTGSIALHRKFDFHDAGVLEKAGYKFERELDVVFMQLAL